MGKLDNSLKLLELLKSRDLITSSEIGLELNVSKRQVVRYIRVLQNAGHRIGSIVGTKGGYYLEDVYLNDNEESALYEAYKTLEKQGFAHIEDLKSALKKINYKFNTFEK